MHKWRWSDILLSGLFDVLPSLNKLSPDMKLETLRKTVRGDRPFSASKIAEALILLGMDPSRFQTKQVFVFLLGRTAGYPVEKEFEKAERSLEATDSAAIHEFECASHQLAIREGKKKVLSYFKTTYITDIRRHCPPRDPFGYLPDDRYRRRRRKLWAINIIDLFCPSFESWYVRMVESDLSEWEADEMTDHDKYGFREWLAYAYQVRTC
jgi:hypothetical protein